MINRIIIKGYRLFDEFELEPNDGVNIIVGDNEAGKSTLLEAIALALTGRIGGRWAGDELNPYWFNQAAVKSYFESLGTSSPLPPPEILIELYLSNEDDKLQEMFGVHNSLQLKAPGIRIRIAPSPAYREEFADYMAAEDRPNILPTEWYEVDWRDFSDERLTRRPKSLGIATVDSRTIRSTSGVDHQTREMITDFIEPKEMAAVSVAHRSARHRISTEALQTANQRIAGQGHAFYDRPIGLHMDQSAGSSWANNIVPQVSDVPFAMAGQGQQAAIKVALAMNRSTEKTAFVLVEEPENHLSYTSLTKLVSRIDDLARGRQVFLTTHSSYVLNRLGLDKLVLLHRGVRASFRDLRPDTVKYFKRLSGYNTLRHVLADKVVLVEGPTDEMVFQRAFRDSHGGKSPIELGIDVVSTAGLAFARGLELCAALDRRVAVVRDNDGKNPDHWRAPLKAWLKSEVREVFIGNPGDGKTLEPQFLNINDEKALRELFEVSDDSKTTLDWMTGNKTEWGLMLAESNLAVKYPQYLMDAIDFIS
ncbi:ATP-dependent nuclease [Nocardia asteroides]|uniref:ATP-dependent nuclease n=1 Tax=Nocardia asteroides TaxID=1824 RepID=UPI001E2CA71A|nr:AAA family ATPase [Nocardia asteroides]UGT64412.1 AAA family ATPase [Nocardia asteroides]